DVGGGQPFVARAAASAVQGIPCEKLHMPADRGFANYHIGRGITAPHAGEGERTQDESEKRAKTDPHKAMLLHEENSSPIWGQAQESGEMFIVQMLIVQLSLRCFAFPGLQMTNE